MGWRHEPTEPLPTATADGDGKKLELLMKHFGSQRERHWFDEETFVGSRRLRGMECRAPERYAEAFFGHKVR